MGGGAGSLSVQAWSPGGSTVGKGDPCSCHCVSFKRAWQTRREEASWVSEPAVIFFFFFSSLPLFLDFILTVKDVGGFRKTPSDECGRGLSIRQNFSALIRGIRISLVLHIQSPPVL